MPYVIKKELDDLTGLYYFGARFYDPELGVWLTPDPAGQFFNPYSYGGDPVNYVDPDGEFVFIAAGIIIGAYIGGSIAQQWTSNSKIEWNPLDWKNEWETYAGVLIGGAVGGLGGWAAEAAFPNAAYMADKAAVTAYKSFNYKFSLGTTVAGIPISASLYYDPSNPDENISEEQAAEDEITERGSFSGINTDKVPSFHEEADYEHVTYTGNIFKDAPLVTGEYLGWKTSPNDLSNRRNFGTIEMHSGGNIFSSLRIRRGEMRTRRAISWGGPFDFQRTGVRSGEVHFSELDPISWLPQTIEGRKRYPDQFVTPGERNYVFDFGWFNGPGVTYHWHPGECSGSCGFS